MDPRRRGEYQGAAELTGTLGRVWAPALYTFLAMSWGAAGWLLIAAIVVLATAGLHPATRVAQRFLDVHVPPEERAHAEESAPPVPAPSLLEDPPLSGAGDGFGPTTARGDGG
ncbi:MAG: hypothetical protein R2731_07980 [Nocardioides sp.]